MRSFGPNLKSLAEVVLKTCLIVCQKIEGSREQGHAPFMEKLFMRQLGFPKAKLLTKFEVSGSCSFEVMFDCMPKI